MKLLDAVNLILPKLGEHGVTRLDIKHPTLAVILPEVEQVLRTTLLRGWWFNQFDYTAYPDPEGEIAVGENILSFVPEKSDTAVQRGLKLYNPTTLSYVFTSPVKGCVTQYVAFDDLPESAAQYVYYHALVNAYVTDLGLTQEVQMWQSLAASGYSDLLAEHLRQRKHSTRRSRRWQRFIGALSA